MCIRDSVNGNPPDEGVMIELGIAIALKKEIFLFRDDFRNCSDNNQYPLNLMLFLGLPKDNWENFYFESLQEPLQFFLLENFLPLGYDLILVVQKLLSAH